MSSSVGDQNQETDIDQKELRCSLGKLISWLETWRSDHGAYNGFVVHRTEAKRMGRVHDTAWTQSAMIRGYGNLFQKSQEPRWHHAMILAADLLASRYDPKTSKIIHTGHEDDRFYSLVSCALGVNALLSITHLVDLERQKKYIQIAKDHIQHYWFDSLWVESEGAFRFSEVDYFSSNENRFVVNFNTMAVEALLAVYKKTGGGNFLEKALRIGEWLISNWDYTQKTNQKLLSDHITVADDPSSEWMAPGGFSYQFTPSQREPDNYVTLYTGLSLRGFWALYQQTGDRRFVDIIRTQSQYILDMRDPNSKLFYHTAKLAKVEKNPQFIAGAGMTLLGLHESMPLIGTKAIPKDTIKSILSRSYLNGSYPNFFGKNATEYKARDGGGTVWEDVAASINWNAQWFEYLTRLIDEPDKIEVEACIKTTLIVNRRFIYIDSPKIVGIISWWPSRSWGLYLFSKKKSKALISIYPVEIYGCIRSQLLKKGQV